MTAVVNCATSFLAGFVVFSVLGYMAFKQGTTVDSVAEQGIQLVINVTVELNVIVKNVIEIDPFA